MTAQRITQDERERWRNQTETQAVATQPLHWSAFVVLRLLDALDAADQMAEALNRFVTEDARLRQLGQYDFHDNFIQELSKAEVAIAVYRRLVEGAKGENE